MGLTSDYKTFKELIEATSVSNMSAWTEIFRVCQERIQLLFNQSHTDLDFTMKGSFLVLDPTQALTCLADLPGLNITTAKIRIQTLTKAQAFEGLSRDGLAYTAEVCVSYLKLPEPGGDPEIGLITQLELDNCREVFTQEWSERTLGDIIETYDNRSLEEQQAFKPTCKPKALRSIQICGSMAVIQYQCKIDALTESRLTKAFMERQKRHDTMMTWLFYCLLGLVGGYIYGQVRDLHKTLRGLHDPKSCIAVHNHSFNMRNCYEYGKSWPKTVVFAASKGYPVAGIWSVFAVVSIYITFHCWYVRILMATASVILLGPAGALVYLV